MIRRREKALRTFICLQTIPVAGLSGRYSGPGDVILGVFAQIQNKMEILRYKTDAWGQRVLEGASWDLIWVFVAGAVAFIIFHAFYTHRKLKNMQKDERHEQ